MATIALVHGPLDRRALAEEHAAALRRSGLDVVLVDGTGTTFEALAEQVVAGLAGAPDAVGMGASVGAAAALAFARRHAEACAALVLVTPPFLYGPRPELGDIARLGLDRGLDWVVGQVSGTESLRRIEPG